MSNSNYKIVSLSIDESNLLRWSPAIEQERKAAIYDIINDNYFEPLNVSVQEFNVNVKLVEWRLLLEIKNNNNNDLLKTIAVSITALRRIIRDYQIVCDNYYEAIKTAPLRKIEAIDVGRRSIHDEGAQTFKELFENEVELDIETARRFFTLICVLSLKI